MHCLHLPALRRAGLKATCARAGATCRVEPWGQAGQAAARPPLYDRQARNSTSGHAPHCAWRLHYHYTPGPSPMPSPSTREVNNLRPPTHAHHRTWFKQTTLQLRQHRAGEDVASDGSQLDDFPEKNLPRAAPPRRLPHSRSMLLHFPRTIPLACHSAGGTCYSRLH